MQMFNFLQISSSQYVGRRISNYDFYKKCSDERVEISGYGRFCGNILPPVFITIDNEIDIVFIRPAGLVIVHIYTDMAIMPM